MYVLQSLWLVLLYLMNTQKNNIHSKEFVIFSILYFEWIHVIRNDDF